MSMTEKEQVGGFSGHFIPIDIPQGSFVARDTRDIVYELLSEVSNIPISVDKHIPQWPKHCITGDATVSIKDLVATEDIGSFISNL